MRIYLFLLYHHSIIGVSESPDIHIDCAHTIHPYTYNHPPTTFLSCNPLHPTRTICNSSGQYTHEGAPSGFNLWTLLHCLVTPYPISHINLQTAISLPLHSYSYCLPACLLSSFLSVSVCLSTHVYVPYDIFILISTWFLYLHSIHSLTKPGGHATNLLTP